MEIAAAGTFELVFPPAATAAIVAALEARGFAIHRDGEVWFASEDADGLRRFLAALADEPGNYYHYQPPFSFVVTTTSLVVTGIWSRTWRAELCRELIANHLPTSNIRYRCNPHHELADFVLDAQFRDVTDRSATRVKASVGANDPHATAWSAIDHQIFVAPVTGTFDLGELGFLLLSCGFSCVTATRFLPPGSGGGTYGAFLELSPTEIAFDVSDRNPDVLAGCHAFAAKLLSRTPCTAYAHRETTYNHDPMRRDEVTAWRVPIVADDIFPPITAV